MSRFLSEKNLRSVQLQLLQDSEAADEIEQSMREIGLSTLWQRVSTIALVDGPVVIEGETGTGKSTLAGWLHALSRRSAHQVIRRGCGEFDIQTFSAALFGHTSDAFTGAVSDKDGILDLADKGTLILDDIDYLDLSTQQSLLRVLDDGFFFRLGNQQDVRAVDVRLIATTNKDLQALCEHGRFLPDLRYRLDRWRIKVPRLSERRGFHSILNVLLGEATVEQHPNSENPPPMFSEDLVEHLARRPWPGNLRQLRDVVANVLAFCPGENGTISFAAAAPVLTDLMGPFQPKDPGSTSEADDAILACLTNTGWNISLTSRILGKSRTTIHARIRENGWNPQRRQRHVQ